MTSDARPVKASAGKDLSKEVLAALGAEESKRTPQQKAALAADGVVAPDLDSLRAAATEAAAAFEANRSAIRDPDLIYPGQVFDLPD